MILQKYINGVYPSDSSELITIDPKGRFSYICYSFSFSLIGIVRLVLFPRDSVGEIPFPCSTWLVIYFLFSLGVDSFFPSSRRSWTFFSIGGKIYSSLNHSPTLGWLPSTGLEKTMESFLTRMYSAFPTNGFMSHLLCSYHFCKFQQKGCYTQGLICEVAHRP